MSSFYPSFHLASIPSILQAFMKFSSMPETMCGPSESLLPMCTLLCSMTLLFLPSGGSLFPHPLNLDWPWFLLWLFKCGISDITQLLSLVSRDRAASALLLLLLRDCHSKRPGQAILKMRSHVAENQDTPANSSSQLLVLVHKAN